MLADIDAYCKCSDKTANVSTNPVTHYAGAGCWVPQSFRATFLPFFCTLQDTDVISYYSRAATDFTGRFTEQFTERLKGNGKEEHVAK